jgi:hypothetical protein
MADAVLADKPHPVVRIGRRSTLLPLLERWIPRRLLDRTFTRRFGLNRIA